MRPLHRLGVAAASAALTAAPVIGVVAPAPMTTPAAASMRAVNTVLLNGFEARLVAEINAARAERGLRPLKVVSGATDVARSWSWHMARVRTLSHNPSLVDDIDHAGSGSWRMVAENVGFGPSDEPATLFAAYMHSTPHRANILDSSARYLGVGVVERDSVAYNTLDFTDAYSTRYGGTHVPPAALSMDTARIVRTTDIASLESGRDERFGSAGHGAVTAGLVRFTGPSAGNDAAVALLRASRSRGRGVLFLRDALDLGHANGLDVRLAARGRHRGPVRVRVVLRRAFGSTVLLGQFTVGATPRWVSLDLPAAGRSFHTGVQFVVPARAISRHGGTVRLSVFDVRARA
jgi:uncharacterized protein YkwD